MKVKDQHALIRTLKASLQERSEPCGIDMAFLYGSWARGNPTERSDVDLAVCFREPRSKNEAFRIITDLSLELSRLIDVEVDVIVLYEDFRRPMLYYNAVVLGVPVYIGDFARYVGFRHQAIAQMEDFGLFGLQWQKQIARRNLERLRNV